MDEAYRICPYLLVLDQGKATAEGPRVAIFSNPPTLATARMMGCQNLSGIRIHTDGVVEALDWGCGLQIPLAKIREGASHLGIYSNHIRLAGNSDNVNIMECRLFNIIESPHHVTINAKLTKTGHEACLKIVWPKEKWRHLGLQKEQLLKIQLPPDKIFLTKDEQAKQRCL